MKKAAKRLLILAMVAACLLVCIPQANADPLPELPADLYLTQNVAGTCTLCSAAMMIRASLYQHNNSNWATVTENGLRKDAWMEGVGLKWSFSHKIGNTTVKVGHKNVSGMTVQALKELLDEHPEGIVLYCGKLPHAVYLTGYVGDEFYCADTVKGISGKQTPISSSWLGIKYGSQATILKKVTAYWYVTDYIYNGQSLTCRCDTVYAGTYVATSASTDLRIRAGHGADFEVLGTVPYGAEVKVLKASGRGTGHWAHIEYNGISGYASMNYLELVACDHLYGQWGPSGMEGEEIRTCIRCGNNETRQAEEGQMGTITATDLRIRAGAGTNYAVRGFLQKGTRVEVFETAQVGDILWGRIAEGWISMAYVEMDEVPVQPQGQKGTITGDELRVRSGAGTNYSIVTYKQKGDRVTVYETQQVGNTLWGRIDEGWVSMDYVELDKEEPNPGPGGEGQAATITANEVRVRSGAGTNYSIVTYKQKGDRVTVYETKQVGDMLWGRIDEGWVSMNYVELDEEEPNPGPGGEGQAATITADEVRVRSGAGTNYSIVTYKQKGDRVTVYETKQVGNMLWGRIDEGWLSMNYVELDDEEPAVRVGTVTASKLRIRAEASASAEVVGTYSEGDRVEILETKEVDGTLWGRTDKGWISMDYVE